MAFDFSKYRTPTGSQQASTEIQQQGVVKQNSNTNTKFDFSKYASPTQNNYTNYGDPKMSLTPSNSTIHSLAPKPAESWTDWAARQAKDTVGEGLMKLGTEAASGVGNAVSGMWDASGGIVQGIGDIARQGYASQESADKLYAGGRKSVGGVVKTLYSPWSAGVAALPQGIQEPVEQGFQGLGDITTKTIDLIPKAIGGATSIIGKYGYMPNLEKIGNRISQSVNSQEWKNVNEDLQQTAALAAGFGMPIVPPKLSYALNAPAEAALNYVAKPVAKAVGKITGSAGKSMVNAGKELATKITNLDRDLAGKVKTMSTTHPDLVPALQGKIKFPDIINNVLDTVKAAKDEVSQMNQGVRQGLANLRDASGKPLKIQVDRSTIPTALSKNGLALTPEMKIVPQGGSWSATGLTPTQVKKFEPIIKEMLSQKETTPMSFWNTRKKTGAMLGELKAKGQYTTEVQRFADSLYDSWNKAARDKIPGLQAQDTLLKSKNDLIKPLQDKLFTPEGELKPGADIELKRFANETVPSKANLQALDNLIPGIQKKFEALNVAEKVFTKSENLPGPYARSAILPAAVTAFLTGHPEIAAGLVAAGAVSNPTTVAKAIASMAKKSKSVSNRLAPTLSTMKNIGSKTSQFIQANQPWEVPGAVLSAIRKKMSK